MGVVQTALGKSSADSLSFDFDDPTTPGNTIVVLIGSLGTLLNGDPSAVTLDGDPDNFALVEETGGSGDHSIVAGWADPDCAGGQTTVGIESTGGTGTLTLFGWAIECDPLSGSADQFATGDDADGTSWSAGPTGTTAQDDEIWFGIMAGNGVSGQATLDGPASPWVNLSQQNRPNAGHVPGGVVGYQVTTVAGEATYAGTAAPESTACVLVFTLPSSGSGPVTAAAELTVSPALAAAAVRIAPAGAALAVAPALAAAAAHTATAAAALTVAPQLRAAAAGPPAAGGSDDYHHRRHYLRRVL